MTLNADRWWIVKNFIFSANLNMSDFVMVNTPTLNVSQR